MQVIVDVVDGLTAIRVKCPTIRRAVESLTDSKFSRAPWSAASLVTDDLTCPTATTDSHG